VLVIALATIVIVASVGIYILLRYGEPSSADRAARRKYSIRRHGVRTHPIPIGLPGSFGEKIGSIFKGRRTGGGWVPARDDDDDDGHDHGGAGEWDATDEPIHERELDQHGEFDNDHGDYPRIGVTPASRLTALTLTDATTAGTHKSREATHVDAGAESSAGLPILGPAGLADAAPAIPFPAAVAQEVPPARARAPPSVPDGEWVDARKHARNSVGGGHAGGSDVSRPMDHYHLPQPRRADSEEEISLFAGSTRFREDI
jgi:hypothetical protein